MKRTTEQLKELLPHFGQEGDGTSEDGYSPYANLRPDEVRDLIKEVIRLGEAIHQKNVLVMSFEPEEMGAMVKELNELRAYLNQTKHFIVFSETGWEIEHTVACTGNVGNCPYHLAAERAPLHEVKGMIEPGRYRCYLTPSEYGEDILSWEKVEGES